ncbi:MAG TPA: pyridoxamine 5'-phosphate oxidase family protein [Cytophagaceae bacterium]|jgi:hypothetical protein
MENSDSLKSKRTTVKRLAKRGVYDRETVYDIFDEALICHVGFIVNGIPMVLPTIHGRVGDNLYLHGSIGSQMLRASLNDIEISISATIVDGIVLARSLFNHSMNYRSAVVIGKAALVKDDEEKVLALKAMSDHVLKQRWEDARLPNEKELAQTMIVKVSISEGSAKIRTGPPGDDAEDMSLDIWAGVIPIQTIKAPPISAPDLRNGIAFPEYLKAFN